MEAEAEESKTSGGWSSTTTNWSIVDGSLENSITVESALSPIDDPQRPSPLILKPPSADSGSCEIKSDLNVLDVSNTTVWYRDSINPSFSSATRQIYLIGISEQKKTVTFTQKHELRQVYVRSTARVYEIYWAPDLHSINEYLCTVRCNAAAKDEKSLHATDLDAPFSAHVEGSDKKLADVNSKNGSSVSSNEDGWVEVKALDSHPLENRSSSLQSKIIANSGSISQDLYEATAEVSDADPCVSLTLRLLSLQNKEHVYVEEIYVFVDPVESDSSDTQGGYVENPAGSSLMTMLMPTILQLSKTGISQKEDKHMYDTRKDQRFLKIGSSVSDSIKMTEKTQVEGKSFPLSQLEVGEASAEQAPSSVKVCAQVPAADNVPESVAKENYLPNNQLEKVMEQLVARVGRMENLFLRFEDSMLKPISSIEARLQRVEQQLETLTMKFDGPEVFAPEYPGNDSDSNSCNEASEEPRHEALEFKLSGNANHLLPSLVVIAPEFSNGDEEENDVSEQLIEAHAVELRENDTLEPARDSSRDKPKHTVSVEDALASALAGFLSSTSTRPSKYTEFLTVRAPEFPCEEDSSEDQVASRTEHADDQISSSCYLSSLDGRAVTEENSLDHEGKEISVECGVSFTVTEENRVAVRIDDHPTSEETGNAEVAGATEASSIPTSDEIYVPPIHFLGEEFDDESDAPTPPKETGEGNDLAASTEVACEQTTTKDILRDVLQFSCSSSTVDFQVPVLDVKFTPLENSNTSSSLEALLTSSSDLGAPALPVADNRETQCHSETTNRHLLLDFDDDGYGGMGGENLQDAQTCGKEAGPFDSLI